MAIKLLWTIGMIVLLVGLVLWAMVRWATPSASKALLLDRAFPLIPVGVPISTDRGFFLICL